MELRSQEGVQKVLSAYRFLAIFVMIATTIVAVTSHSEKTSVPPTADKMSSFAVLWGTIGTSQICHFCFPTVCEGSREKKGLYPLFSAVFITSFLLFAGLGGVGAIYCYGKGGPEADECVNKLVTLEWNQYTGSAFDGSSSVAGVAWWAVGIRYFIAAFPVIAMLSNYPLAGLSFGNNIYTMIPDSTKERLGEHKTTIVARLIGAIPPIGLACAMSDLQVVFEVVGAFAYVLGFILPSAFYLASVRQAEARGIGELATAYTQCWSSPALAWVVMTFGIACIIFTAVANILT